MSACSRRQFSLLVCASVLVCARSGFAADLPDYTQFDLTKHGLPPVKPTKDAKTGFVVGGRNSTELIKSLREIAGRSIADLEADMRPGAKVEHGSDTGFLGKDEKLLDVLAQDNALVVDQHGLTHQQIARHLHALGAIADHLETQHKPTEFRYHGRRYRVQVQHTRGFQLSPFLDGTKSGSNAQITNLDNDQSLHYGLLVPFMIERYGFYEGEGTEYRLDPQQALAVLDFLPKSSSTQRK